MHLTDERVHTLLATVWMEQACRRPADRQAVFDRLMSDAPRTQGAEMHSAENKGRGSLKPAFEEAVAALTAAFGADTPPDDPVTSVYLAFSRLDLAHRTQLAALLMKERADAELP